jgi:aminoglycoside 6'-N-acetyltransferase I
VVIRRFQAPDLPDWGRMRRELWPDISPSEGDRDMRAWLARTDAVVFVACRTDGSLCGFVEAASRPYADGCDTSPVAYIEGWYVDADMRRQGVGRALLAEAEAWARAAGYREIASDALLDNAVSHRAHERAGYGEVDRVVLFRKWIG